MNQNKAGRIKAITGVALISSIGKSIKAAKAFESAAQRPKKIPKSKDIKKEIRTRRKVKAKAFQKTAVTASSKSLFITRCGKGRIRGAAIIADTAYHIRRKKNGERILQIFILFIPFYFL